jgi:alkylation response protein AidB-like acyl-CoA dehydrogenase
MSATRCATSGSGTGWTAREQFIFEALCSGADCPPINPLGLRMVGQVIQRFGTPWQQERFLAPIRESREWWCQGYSEPNAGSDLASLTTRAERRGDRYVVNGQKIWTSYAHWADWMFCLVRTSRESKSQHGISFLLLDMKSPGIEVRPIVQLDGTHNFNQVFFTDVEVPLHQLVGEEGQGWTCAKYLLTHERLETAALPVCWRSSRSTAAPRRPTIRLSWRG